MVRIKDILKEIEKLAPLPLQEGFDNAGFIIRKLFKNNLLKNFSWFHIFAYGVIGFVIVISVIWILTILIYKTL